MSGPEALTAQVPTPHTIEPRPATQERGLTRSARRQGFDWALTAQCVPAGLRLGLSAPAGGAGGGAAPVLVRHMDQLLLDRQELWPALQPDVVLQLGGRLTSKRLAQFLEWAALGDGR